MSNGLPLKVVKLSLAAVILLAESIPSVVQFIVHPPSPYGNSISILIIIVPLPV